MRSPFRRVEMLCIATVLLLAACDVSPKEREAKYIAHGKSLYESGDLAKAKLEFRNAAQINPGSSEAQYYLGLIAEKQNDLSAAAAADRRAADSDPKHFDAHLKAAQLTLMGGNVDAAAAYADEMISLAPQRPEGHTVEAATMLLRGKVSEAEKEANKALELDPKNVDAFVVLAGVQTRAGKNDQALSTVERGLAINPKNIDLLVVKLKLMFDQKRDDQVLEVLQQLHAIQPENANFVIDLANRLAAANRLAEADAMFKEAVASAKNPDTLVAAYASFLAARKTVDQAVDEIKALMAHSKQSSNYTFLLEQLYLKAGKFDQAEALVSELQQSTTVTETRLQAKVELARITLLKGDKQGALDQLGKIFEENPGNQSAFLLRGLIMLNDGKYDNAIADARSVLHNDINSIGGLTILAKAYAGTGETDLAIQTLRTLTRLAPTNIDARLLLASLLTAKSPADALDQLNAAIALRPDATELQVQKAEFLIRTGSADKAEVIGRELVKSTQYGAAGHLIIGEAAFARADYATAITEVSLAEAQGQPFATVGPLLMNAYIKAGKIADAEKMLKDRIAKDAGDAKATVLLGVLRARTGNEKEAEALFTQAIAIKPNDGEAYLNLAQLLSRQRRYQEEAKILEAARQKIPGDGNIATYLAIAYDEGGQFDAAKKVYEEIIARWPDNMVAANNLAALIADTWGSDTVQLDRARQIAERFRASPNPLLLDTLGWVLARQGNFDDAAIVLAKATSMAPDNQQIQFHYAVALAGKGLKEKAKDAVAKALSGTPDYRGLDEAKKLATTVN